MRTSWTGVIWRRAGGTVERTRLPIDRALSLTEPGLCRHVSSIAAGALAGKPVIRITGDTDNCCKNLSSIDELYEWNGTVLDLTLDLTR